MSKVKSLQIARLIRPDRKDGHGSLVVVRTITAKSCPMQSRSKTPERVGFRGMWYNSTDPHQTSAFGKVEKGGMLSVGKTVGRLPYWLARKI